MLLMTLEDLGFCKKGEAGSFVEGGDCGSRQVPDAELACVSGTGGWFCSSGTMILGRG